MRKSRPLLLLSRDGLFFLKGIEMHLRRFDAPKCVKMHFRAVGGAHGVGGLGGATGAGRGARLMSGRWRSSTAVRKRRSRSAAPGAFPLSPAASLRRTSMVFPATNSRAAAQPRLLAEASSSRLLPGWACGKQTAARRVFMVSGSCRSPHHVSPQQPELLGSS